MGFIASLSGCDPHVPVHAIPARLVGEIEGEIEGASAGEIAVIEAHAVSSERQRGRRPVVDELPGVDTPGSCPSAVVTISFGWRSR